MDWFTNHWQDLLAIYGGLVMIATVIVKFTPSQRDDAILAKVVALLNWFSTANPK